MHNQGSDALALPRVSERNARSSVSTRALTLLAADLAGFAAASLLVLGASLGTSGGREAVGEGWATLPVLLILMVTLGARGRYTERMPFWIDFGRLAAGAIMALLAENFLHSELFGTPCDGAEIARWALFVPMVTMLRQIARAALQARGLWSVKTLLVGDGPALAGARAALASEPGLGYEVVGAMGAQHALSQRLGANGREALRALGADFVVVAMGSRDMVSENRVAAALARAQVPFALVPAVDGVPVRGLATQYFMAHDVMLLTSGNNLARPACRVVKGVFDQVVAALALVLLSPLFLVLCAAIRMDGGPAFFGHRRLGEGGQRFGCLKFRSMRVDADQVLRDLLARDPAARLEWQATQKLRHDPRVTRIGAVLRRTSLDELPQLLNVLRGEMSLVGPRPIVDAEVPRYGENIGFYYEAKPGMTGLWQVSGRSNTSYEHRVRLDVWYVRNWSLLHDLAILLKTVPAVLLKQGAV